MTTLFPRFFSIINWSYFLDSHGNKEVFSCRGLRICVDWFKQRGHSDVKVVVPMFRKEPSRPEAPISGELFINTFSGNSDLEPIEQQKFIFLVTFGPGSVHLHSFLTFITFAFPNVFYQYSFLSQSKTSSMIWIRTVI